MPKLKNRPPRMTRNRATAVVHIDGETIRLGQWGSDEARQAYDRLISEWLANGRRLPAPAGEEHEPTVSEVLVAYWRHAKARYTPSEADSIQQALRLTRKLYGSEPAEAFGPKRLRTVREAMVRGDADVEPPRRPWSRGYVNQQVSRIRRAFRWAAGHELCSERIYRRLEAVEPLKRGEATKEGQRVKPVPREHVRRVRRHLSRPVRALVTLQLLTGARADELVRLKATDFDRREAVWTVTYDGTGEGGSHKTAHHGRERTLYFGPRAQRIVGLFMQPGRPLDEPLFSPREANAEAKRKDGAKGRRHNQKPTKRKTDRTIAAHYTTASYRRAIHRASDKAGVPKWGPHRLRHNAATFLRRDFGIEVASIILGHASLAVTQTYAEQNHKRAIDVMREVG